MSAWPQLHRLQPDGGRVLELEVPELRISIPDAVRTVAPNTSEGSLIWQMTNDPETEKRKLLFLVNFGSKPMCGADIYDWMHSHQLIATDFRDACAVCAHVPNLHERLQYANVGIVSTRVCKFSDQILRMGCIWVRQSWREAAFIPVAVQQPFDSSMWFVFR